MSHVEVLSAVGLIRASRRRGFCPACRLFQSGDTPKEIAAPGLLALASLAVAAVAWGVTIGQSTPMDGMAMGLGPIGAFVAGWALMTVAMMLPTATPLVFEFARNAEGRRGWVAATALLAVTYVGVWLAFGVAAYALYNAAGMPWANQRLVGGAALVLAGMYALTPLKHANEASCRELCALHGPLPFNLMRSAVVAGVRYGLSCLGCSAGLMVAIVLIGMNDLAWMLVVTAVIAAYKLAPAPTPRTTVALSAVVVALGGVYAFGM
jgi:predicted metal-binding membrane protein